MNKRLNCGMPALHRWAVSIVRNPDTGCWEWQGTLGTEGYGQILDRCKKYPAHRWSYLRFIGPIPDGLELDHLCRNRACVNPTHLDPVTRQENLRRSPLMGQACAKKTHCPQGHPYDKENTAYVHPSSGGRRRICKTCRKAWNKKRVRRKETKVA